MSDTIDRENEKLEEEQNAQESASQADAGVEAAAEGSPNAEQEAPKEEQQPQNEWKPEVTAVQFPRLDAEDLPPESPNAIPDIPLEDEELPTLEDDKPESMGKLYDFVAKMDDRQFRRAQIIFGCAIGLLGALALMIPIGDSTGSSMWSFVIALFILVWLPNIVERKTDKKIPTARKWMLIVFVIGMALVMGINALNGAYSTQPAAASPSPRARASTACTAHIRPPLPARAHPSRPAPRPRRKARPVKPGPCGSVFLRCAFRHAFAAELLQKLRLFYGFLNIQRQSAPTCPFFAS